MKDPNYKRQKKTLGLYLSSKLYQQIEKISDATTESRSATAKMLLLLGLNVYMATGEAAADIAEESRKNRICLAKLD